MSIINRDWSRLKESLAKSDPKIIQDKKIGIDKTLIISVQDLKYDSSIPILNEDDLERWIECRKQAIPFRREPDEDTNQAQINHIDESDEEEQNHCHRNKENQVFLDAVEEQEIQQTLETEQPETEDREEINKSQEQVADEDIQNSNKLTDELVINEPEDDEFAKFKDDDDDKEETQMSRNLKKIRSTTTTTNISNTHGNLPKKKNNTQISPCKVNANPKTNTTTNNKSSPKKKSPTKREKKIQLETVPIVPKEPAKPNWPETDNYIKQNQLEIAFRDLDHFKDHINSDDMARPLLLELVKKCLQEDETRILDESLNLIYHLGLYTDEIEFWSELVLRLKRKLIVYDNVKNFNFKTKANANQVHDNYKRILLNFSEHAKKINQTFKLPIQAIIFVLEPLKVLEPDNFKHSIDIKPKVEQESNQKQNSENETQTNNSTNCHQVLDQTTTQNNNKQINGNQHININNNQIPLNINTRQNDNIDRQVFLIKNKSGRDSFKILMSTKTKTNITQSSTSSSLHATQNGNIFNRRL